VNDVGSFRCEVCIIDDMCTNCSAGYEGDGLGPDGCQRKHGDMSFFIAVLGLKGFECADIALMKLCIHNPSWALCRDQLWRHAGG